MALSKNIKHYRCLHLANRCFQTEIESPKMTTKLLSASQWKLLAQLKEYYNDKNMHQLFSKELATLLQKFQPSIYGHSVIKNFGHGGDENSVKHLTDSVAPNQLNDNVESKQQLNDGTVEGKNQGYSLPSVLSGWKLKIGRTEALSEVKPKWKVIPSVSKDSVLSRTNHVISMISTAESDTSKLRRIEDFIEHLQQFPEAKHHAFKEGASRLLLRLKQYTKNSEIKSAVREAFAVLGYLEPLPNHGIRILSIDGGGVRGLLVIEMLRKLEQLTGQRVHEMFDVVCGVSTGALLACALGACQKDLDALQRYYKELSIKVFNQNAFWGTSNLVWSHSYYDTKIWENILREFFGDLDMVKSARAPNCPKVLAVSAVVNQPRAFVYVFRNYSLPYRVRSQYAGGAEHKVWEAVRASAAAPTYFEEFKLGNYLHQDGGIMVNNPTAVAIHEARQLWPNTPIQCVVSFGTGRTSHLDFEPVDSASNSSWKNKFLKILDSATDTESVHLMLNDLLPPNTYFRLNPYLTEMLEMVEYRAEKLDQLERDAIMYLRRNEDKFQAAAKKLVEPRTAMQKVVDWIHLKRDVLGVTAIK